MAMPATMSIEFFGNINPYVGMGIKIITSLILGGLIGYDRETKMKTAGIKTNIMICLGATLFTASSFLNLADHPNSDPNRIAAQIVSGIGFLGAGTIFHGRGFISGLTTAATMWVVAAIGVAIGSGFPITATIFTITVLVVLSAISPIYNLFGRQKDFHMEVLASGDLHDSVREMLLKDNFYIREIFEEMLDPITSLRIIHVVVRAQSKLLSNFVTKLVRLRNVRRVHFYDHDGESKGSLNRATQHNGDDDS
ncbi:MAG: hypothetical protein A2X86_01580 [Bdellovibrionales bacterium GWA2_49_15]|nr:MAG: hypothetical protein A2X86_01580 [Bdellovibrionales bacterium GWA2_49_15]